MRSTTQNSARSKAAPAPPHPDDPDAGTSPTPTPPSSPPSSSGAAKKKRPPPSTSLDPYIGKLERFELFQTNQCYYLIGCNKSNTQYRVLTFDRTLIERPAVETVNSPQYQANNSSNINSTGGGGNNNTSNDNQHHSNGIHKSNSNVSASGEGGADANLQQQQQQASMAAEASHNAKPTLRPLSDFLREDDIVYTQEEIKDLLDVIHDGNRLARGERSAPAATTGGSDGTSAGGGGGLKPIVRAYGIVGLIRFLDCYYLTLITRRAKVGSIGGNGIYTIKGTESFPLKPRNALSSVDADQQADPSSVLLSMWNRGKRQIGLGLTGREIAELRYQGLFQVINLTQNFYFSYTYDLTRSLQENFLSNSSQPFPPPPFKDMYAWNYFLTRELEGCLNSLTSYHWVMPVIHGAFVQRKLNDYGRSLNLILVARRSRHFAGTRYLKRGVNEQGKVANDVEHEQILHDESTSASAGTFSSYIQVRGSIPTFWTQESSVTMPKPPIELSRVDPIYTATQLHFQDLFTRYGSPICVWDLVKQSEKREREVRVGNEFRHGIDYINTSIDEDHKIRYCALDYSHISKHRNLDVSTSLNEVATWAVNQTGFFCSSPKWKILEGGRIEPFDDENARGAALLTEQLGVPVFPMEQRGVLRTNCIDCLDRTNVAQFSAGVEAIEQQLVVMGIRSSAKLDSTANIVRVLIDMYVDIGDSIALQYGGSEAHKKVNTENSQSTIAGPMGKHKELLTSIRRYYSNAFTDRLKQDAMNLFLGYYVPYRHSTALWDLQDDFYLHNYHVKTGKGTMHSMQAYQRAFGIEWQDEEIADGSQRNIANSHLPPRPLAERRESNTSAKSSKENGESRRIAIVRERCVAQNKALSVWWKAAIQANIKSRMWMQLGSSPTESLLPPRFERLYQPEKIAQFDRFFARAWATPVRRSHSAQHSKGSSDDETGARDFRRSVSVRKSTGPVETKTSAEVAERIQHDKNNPRITKTLDMFVNSYGLQPHFKPTLKSFVKDHDIKDRNSGVSSRLTGVSPAYLGRIGLQGETPRPEYQIYAKPASESFSSRQQQYRPGALEEFKNILHDFSLKADDVGAIRKLAESAHIGHTIKSGQYRGLSQDESAIETATLVHEQFNALENMRSRGDLSPEGISLVDLELKRRGLDASGVRDTVATGWERYNKAEKAYSEVLQSPAATCRRSDLTTPSSLMLYTSLFDEDTQLSIPDLIFLLGRKPAEASHEPAKKSLDYAKRRVPFVETAASMGVPIVPHGEVMTFKSPPLFNFDRERKVPPGFEQVNETMFARKDNKFMVFNGPGVDSWKGTEPVTKVIRAPEELAEPELVPLSALLSEVGSYAAVDNSGSTGGARLRVAKGFVDAIGVNLVSLWNSNCNDPVSSASVRWASMGGTAPHTIFEPKNKVPRNASCFVFMTDGEIYDTARLAQHASLTAHLPSLLVLFRSGNNPSERVTSYNVSVVMAHFAAARTAAVLVINNENDPSARVIATKGDWQDALPPALALDDTLLLQECPLVSVQQLQTLPSRVYESMAVGSMPLQDGRVLNLGALLNLQDGRELVADLSETELEDIARAYLARGDLGAWRSRLNMWLSQVNTEATMQEQQWTQHTTNGAHSLLRRLGETENDQERHALRTELQTAMREGALREQEARNRACQAARQPRAILNAALAAVTALERTGMNATSLGRLSNRAARANTIDRSSLASLATLDTEGAPETEDLILLDSGPVALCLRSMTQVELNTGDEALNQALAVGQFRENAVFEPTIVSLSMADRMEELGTSPLTRQSLSVCLPIVSLQDSANRQAVYERLCLVFMDGLAMQHVWLIALSSILRTLETEPWADPESTPTGRLLHFFATQIMKHTTLPQGSKLSPNAHQPVNTALASILRSEILTVHSSVAEASVILRLLLRFSGPAAFSEADLRQSMLARIATAIPQMHRNWLQANAVDPWADQGPSSLAALLSSVYQTRLDGGGTHVAVSGSGRIVDSLSDLVSPAAMTAIAAFAQSIRSTVDDLVVPGLTLVVLGTLDRVTAPHVSSSVAVQLVRTAGAATAAEMDPTTAGTSIPDEVLVQVRRRLAWARTPLHPLSPFMSPFGPSVFWFYAIDGTVINMAESFAVVPGEAENDSSSFLFRLTEHLRETRGQLMARYYGTQQSGGFSVRSTTFPMYREMADEFNEMPGTIDLTRPDEVNNYIHRVVQRIVGRSGISSGNTHAEHMERDVTLLLPSLLESVAAFSGNVRAEPRPIPLARRVELELGGRSPDALGDSPPSPIWVPVDDPGLLETLVRVQQTQDRARVNALRRRLTNINHQQRTQGGPAAEAQRGLSPSNMGRFQRAVTWFLRHGATETRRDGYVSIHTLVDALSCTFGHATIDQVLEVAETDEKGRLSVIEENGVLFIRANQGHTITTVDPEALMAPIESAADISVCLHGTYEDALVGILRSGGINRMARQAIQMAIGLPDDPLVRSGIRPSADIVIYIDVDRAMRQHGLRFFRSDNNVICCAGPIPVDCFIKVIRLRDGTVIDF